MQYETSIKDFNGALELDSNYSKAYFSRATSYLLLKKTDKAIEDFKKSLACEEDVDEAGIENGIGNCIFEIAVS